MKQPHSTTPQPAGPSLKDIGRWPLRLFDLHARLAPHFARSEPRHHALLYLQAVLSDIPRKNGWQIAEHAKQAHPYGIQRLLSAAVWDQEGVRDELRRFLCQALTASPAPAASATPFPVLVIDESGFLKRGQHSAGVARQDCGTTGRIDNCQVGVFLSYVTKLGHGLIDRELYLPEDWCQDSVRRLAAHIPEAVRFQTKPELAQRMIERAQAADLSIAWVVGDTVYGHCPQRRAFLEAQGYAYALGVPSIEVIAVQRRGGCLLNSVATIAHETLGPTDWQRLSQSLGTKGERLFDWAILPWLQAGQVDGRHFLVVRRDPEQPNTLDYFLVFAPQASTLATIVVAIGARWHVEEDLQSTKALGLDEYEVRSYVGWYRHLTLVLLAAALLVGICLEQNAPRPAPEHAGEPTPTVIALTSRQGRHLLARLIWPAPTSAAFICGWSWWRRTHQYWAGYYHRPRRAKAGSACRLSHLTVPGLFPGVLRAVLLGHLPGPTPGSFPGSTSGWLSFLLHVSPERRSLMTFVSLSDATRRLSIDAKTLRGFLAQAQLPLQSHPRDGRKKGMSSQHLHLLARLHQRCLAPFPEVPPVPVPGEVEALPAALLALPERLSALQTQMAALQQQVTDLTRLLQQEAQKPVSLAAQAQPSRRSKRPPKPAPAAARSRPAASATANTPRKPVQVIPRVEYGEQGHYVVICPKQGLLPFEPDTPQWFAWLAEPSSFRFMGKAGHFSAHHEWRVPRGAWRAHRQIRNQGYHLRLAPTQDLTIAVLEQAAATVQAHLT